MRISKNHLPPTQRMVAPAIEAPAESLLTRVNEQKFHLLYSVLCSRPQIQINKPFPLTLEALCIFISPCSEYCSSISRRHASHITCHTSHVTRHTSLVTRHRVPLFLPLGGAGGGGGVRTSQNEKRKGRGGGRGHNSSESQTRGLERFSVYFV